MTRDDSAPLQYWVCADAQTQEFVPFDEYVHREAARAAAAIAADLAALGVRAATRACCSPS